MATAYSYVRFSTEKQELGASLARQVGLAEGYAKKHGLHLNSQTYKDLGVSAFKGANANEGALSLFLKACSDGIIPRGSFLLVENLDRLSRQDVQTALSLFQSITNQGISIVTLTDNIVYSTQSINENWTQLIIALSHMNRAHEESKRKSQLITDGWRKNKERAKTSLEIMTGKGPSWLKAIDGKWVLQKEKVKAVKKVFELAVAGHGTIKIARLMNEKFKIPTLGTSEFWGASSVASLLSSPAVTGRFQRRDQPDEIIDGYYPKIIEPDVFFAVREKVINRRRKTGPRGEKVNNLFSGLLFCSCGEKMRAVNSNKQHYYVRCLKAYSNAGCDTPIVAYPRFEDAMLGVLVGILQIPLNDVTSSNIDPSIAIRGEIENKRKILEKLVEAIELGDGESSALSILVKRIAKTELEINILERSLRDVVAKPDIDGLGGRAMELLFKHGMLKKNGDSEELREIRMLIASTIQTQISKIVFRFDMGEFEYVAPFGDGEIITGLHLDLHGQLIDTYRENGQLTDKITFTADGAYQSSYFLHLGPIKANLTKRRNRKPKAVAI